MNRIPCSFSRFAYSICRVAHLHLLDCDRLSVERRRRHNRRGSPPDGLPPAQARRLDDDESRGGGAAADAACDSALVQQGDAVRVAAPAVACGGVNGGCELVERSCNRGTRCGWLPRPSPAEEKSGVKDQQAINTHTHTHTHRQRTTPPTPTPTHTTRTTPQTHKRTPPTKHLSTLEGGATTVCATSHARVGGRAK